MSKLLLILFLRKAENTIFSQNQYCERLKRCINHQERLQLSPECAYIYQAIFMTYLIKTNRNLKYVKYNAVSLYDTFIFIAYIFRMMHFSKYRLSDTRKRLFDNRYIHLAFHSFNELFNFRDNSLDTTNSRFQFYDETFKEYNQDNLIAQLKTVLNEFSIIIKSDIITEKFLQFGAKSPLYMLETLEDDMTCENESNSTFTIAVENFKNDFY